PDLAIYFRVPIEVSLDRLLGGRAKLKYHEAGMDLGLAGGPGQSFRVFQSRVLDLDDRLAQEFGVRVVDATGVMPTQQTVFRRMVQEVLRGYTRPPAVERGNGARR